ncbi:MAG: adenosine kinase [Bacteroidales bacterium]|nr:adenosine kinase [Bacteroidales bacterium]
MKSVIGIGNALTDVLAVMPDTSILKKYNLPIGSMQWVNRKTANGIWEDIKDLKIQIVPGGSAANTITGTAVLGMRSGFVGMVGDDAPGRLFRESQESIGIHPVLLTGMDASGRAIVFITPPNAERTFADYMGASLELGANDLKDYFFAGYDILHLEGYLVQNHALVRRAAEIGKTLGMTISIDLASYNVVESNYEFLHEIVEKYVDIVFANESEAKAFTHKAPEEALDAISRVAKIAVVKVGKEGSMVKSGDEVFRIEPFLANAVDATGAGDLYAAGFLYGYAQDLPLGTCGKIGSYVSSRIVEVVGTKLDSNSWKTIKEEVAGIIAEG